MKAVIPRFFDQGTSSPYMVFNVVFYDGTGQGVVEDQLDVDMSAVNSTADFVAAVEALILSAAAGHGYTGFTKSDIVYAMPNQALPNSFANPSRSLNSAFQISTTRDALVSYSVDVACALSLTTGQQGTVYLRYADDSGFTTNVVEVCRFVNGNTGTLAIGLALTQNATGTLSGAIPAGKYVKLVTENNTGTPTFTYRRAQEVLI